MVCRKGRCRCRAIEDAGRRKRREGTCADLANCLKQYQQEKRKRRKKEGKEKEDKTGKGNKNSFAHGQAPPPLPKEMADPGQSR